MTPPYGHDVTAGRDAGVRQASALFHPLISSNLLSFTLSSSPLLYAALSPSHPLLYAALSTLSSSPLCCSFTLSSSPLCCSFTLSSSPLCCSFTLSSSPLCCSHTQHTFSMLPLALYLKLFKSFVNSFHKVKIAVCCQRQVSVCVWCLEDLTMTKREQVINRGIRTEGLTAIEEQVCVVYWHCSIHDESVQ